MLIKSKKTAFLLTTFLSLFGLGVVLLILSASQEKQTQQTQQLLVQEATAHYNTIKELEIWHNKFGGIFLKESLEGSYHFDISSLNPKNQTNHAKGFAKEALEYFTAHPQEKIYYRFFDNTDVFKFSGILHTKESCVTCHDNFKVGDVRGAIEIHIPHEKYTQSLKSIESDFFLFKVLVLGFFLVTLTLLLYFIHKMYENKEKIETINLSLEEKVHERTLQVQTLYNREHYLKKLLETVSEVNESLIQSYSLGSIIETSLEKLSHHQSYKLILFAYYDGEHYHLKYKLGDIYHLFAQTEYTLDEIAQNPFLQSTYEAIMKQEMQVDRACSLPQTKREQKRKGDYDIFASISFILNDDNSDTTFNILTIFTNRQEHFDQEEIAILEASANDISMALSAFKQRKLTEKLQNEQISNYEETVLAFVDMIEQRDAYTAGHTVRVARYSRMIAERLGFDNSLINKIEKAAILHDIGKIATPDTILLKPGKLNALEYKLIQNHVTAGYKMLSKVQMYAELAEIIKFHHEHYDGTGYPFGYKGDEIPMEAHVLIVADAFDAMTSNRIYKGRKSVSDALGELAAYSGTQFHPKVIDATLEVLKDVNINQTTQMPQNELEKQRFAYFFNDNLTGLYNEAYLRLVLQQKDKLTSYNVIKLHHFSDFNKQYSWSKGNELLTLIANELKMHFPESKIFRFEGDDFLILSSKNVHFQNDMIQLLLIDPQSIIQIEAIHGMLQTDQDFDTLYGMIGLER